MTPAHDGHAQPSERTDLPAPTAWPMVVALGITLAFAGLVKPRTINDQWIHAEGPIKTFTLRGIKDSPPYLHDGRPLTLEDTVEFFNLVLGVQLTPREKAALVAFMRQL